MARYVPYTETTTPPRDGEGYEVATLDLKHSAEKTAAFHLAKDIAAFANHLGGTIVVGIPEQNGVAGKPLPLSEQQATATQDAYSRAVLDRCSPRPLFDFVRLRIAGGCLLAVNVEPALTQPVGVRVGADKARDGYGGDAWVFPVRGGSHGGFILPEQLPMFMLPHLRRTVVLLESIPPHGHAKVALIWRNPRNQQDAKPVVQSVTLPPFNGISLVRVDLLANVFTVNLGGVIDGQHGVSIPLDDVEVVWEVQPGEWRVRLSGHFEGDVYHSNPRGALWRT